jgi:hypothetical protein
MIKNKKVLIRLVTWNLMAQPPPNPEDVNKILLPKERFHLYIIGSEECENTIAMSAINASKKKWETYLTQVIGPNYVRIRAQTLQAIHLMIFAHLSIASYITEVKSATVATGIGNTLGNKGGVAISFRLGNTSLLFINAHLNSMMMPYRE